jgi:4-amino-4-deoxychorismate lyase
MDNPFRPKNQAVPQAVVQAEIPDDTRIIETFRVDADGFFPRRAWHFARMTRSAQALDFLFDPARAAGLVDALISNVIAGQATGDAAENVTGRGGNSVVTSAPIPLVSPLSPSRGFPLRARLTVGKTGDINLETAPLAADSGPWRLSIAAQRLRSDDPWLRHKTTQRRIYDIARANLPLDVNELLFLNEKDELCEGTITNVFVTLADGRRVTPPLSSGCLPGILRQQLLATGAVSERVITVSDLEEMRSISVGNSLRGEISATLSNM